MSLNVKIICPKCFGIGIYDRGGKPIDPCPTCLGTKEVDIPEIIDDTLHIARFNAIDDDLAICKRRLKKIMDKLEVLDT